MGERTPVGPEHALWRRLLLSLSDLDEARASLRRLRELDEFDAPTLKRSADFVAHTVCLVISYCRPFKGNKDPSVATPVLPDSVLDDFTDEELRMHERLKNLRDQEFAHSDTGPASIHDDASIHLGRYRIPAPVLRVTRHPFTRSDLPVLESMFQKLNRRLGKLYSNPPKPSSGDPASDDARTAWEGEA